jgi:hypothetical protein
LTLERVRHVALEQTPAVSDQDRVQEDAELVDEAIAQQGAHERRTAG